MIAHGLSMQYLLLQNPTDIHTPSDPLRAILTAAYIIDNMYRLH